MLLFNIVDNDASLQCLWKRVFQADSLKIPDLVDALLPLFAWDAYVEGPLFAMRADTAQRAFCIL